MHTMPLLALHIPAISGVTLGWHSYLHSLNPELENLLLCKKILSGTALQLPLLQVSKKESMLLSGIVILERCMMKTITSHSGQISS